MIFGSLFSGIGGLDLGLERSGMRCAWQVEIDPYARRVLERHWPGVRRWDDVRTFPPEPCDGWGVDLIAGGFPCQPFAVGGLKLIDADVRWLWPEFARVVGTLRPRFILLENVAALLDRGFDAVLSSLAEMGFAAEWGVLSACAFGAPHTRERMFLVAYPDGLDGQAGLRVFPDRAPSDESPHAGTDPCHWVVPFSGVAGVADGIPCRVDRLRTLGNAVVPQVAEWIGRRIMETTS